MIIIHFLFFIGLIEAEKTTAKYKPIYLLWDWTNRSITFPWFYSKFYLKYSYFWMKITVLKNLFEIDSE